MIWPDRGSNPRSNTLAGSTLTIAPLMRFQAMNCFKWNAFNEKKNYYYNIVFIFQKVYFEMHSTFYDKQFYSTVRGCAWDCVPQNDFRNCSRDLYSSRGCIEKLCCNDNDLCNSSQTNHVTNCSGLFLFLTTIITGLLTNQRKSKLYIFLLCLYLFYHQSYSKVLNTFIYNVTT